jgi:chromatin remodeling complex protein RSC6
MEVDNTQIDENFKGVFAQLNTFYKQSRTIQEELRVLHRTVKQTNKNIRAKKKRPQVKLNISSELANFLKVDSSTQLSKAEVMKQISQYIKEKQLQSPQDKRKFKPNKELSKIFKVAKPQNITFVEINKFVSPHMTK